MAGRNIPGMNEKLMRQLMSRQPRAGQTQDRNTAADEFAMYKKKMSPAMQKMMWPSLITSMLSDPIYAEPILKGIGSKGLTDAIEPLLGPMGGAATLIPSALSSGYRSRKLAAERQYAPQLGAVGKASRAMDSLASIRSLMTLPGYTAQLLGMGTTLRKYTPKTEHFLTGTVGKALSGQGADSVAGGGILSAGYRGMKGAANWATGGHVSGALASATKQGGLAGAAAGGVGMLNKGITSMLASPMGVSMGMVGAQIGLAIYKSVKLAKITPRRQSPDNLGRKYYGTDTAGPAMQRVLQMAGTGKVDPGTLSFMVLQVMEGDLRRSNVLLAGLRGELASESDFIRQEKEKGEKGFGGTYGSEVLGEDDRGIILKGLDALENTINKVNITFNPFRQLTDFAFGLLSGKIVTPKGQKSKFAQMYGYSDEKDMMKEKSAAFGVAFDQTRLLHLPSKAISEMAPTFESKQLALASATLDINRFMLAELMTIRLSGFGIKENILHRKEPGAFAKFMTTMSEKFNPLNLPGVNAVWNLLKVPGKIIKGIAAAPKKLMEGVEKGAGAIRDFALGEDYKRLRDETELKKESGLYKDTREAASEFIAVGLPGVLGELRHINIEQLEVQQNLLSTQMQMLELQGGYYEYAETQKGKILVWDETVGKWLDQEQAEKIKKSKETRMTATKEVAFAGSPLGKLTKLYDFLTTPIGMKQNVGDIASKFGEVAGYQAGVGRMGRAEHYIGEKEVAITGERETFRSEKIAKILASTMTSIQQRTGVELISKQAEETKRKFDIVDSLERFGVGLIGIVGGMLTGGILTGVAGAGHIGYKIFQRKKIAKATKKGTLYRTEEEKLFAEMAAAAEKSLPKRAAEAEMAGMPGGPFSGPLPKSGAGGSVLSATNLTNEKLDVIAKRLGVSEEDNVYTLLAPNMPKIAEVTMVDNSGDSVFSRQGAKIYQFQKQAAKGDPDAKPGEAILTGEHGLEGFSPKVPGMIIPSYKMGGIFGGIYQTLREMLKLDIHESKKGEEADKEMTMTEKLTALAKKTKEKAQEIWQKSVVGLLSSIKEKDKVIHDKPQKEDKGGFFSTVWDFIKGNVGKILGGLAGGLLAKLLWDNKEAAGGLLKDAGGFILTTLQNMSPGGRIATGAITGATLGMLGGPMGMITGALTGAMVGGVISSIFEFISTFQSKGLGDAITQLFAGDEEGGLMSAFKTMGPYAAAGALAGTFVFPAVGTIVGGLIGAAIGGIVGYLGQWAIADFATNMSNSLVGMIAEGNNTVINWFSGPGQKYGEKFASLGGIVLPFFGPLIGGLVGSIVDLVSILWTSISRVPGIADAWIRSGFKAILPGKIYNALFGEADATYEKVKAADSAADSAETSRAAESKQARQGSLDDMEKGFAADKARREQRANAPKTPGGAPGGTSPAASAPQTNPTQQSPVNIPLSAPGSISQILQNASATTGAPLDILTSMAYAESKFDPNAKATTSSASGLFQFLKDTWTSITGSKGKKYGITSQTSPFDANANAIMGGEFINENIKAIQGSTLTSPPTAADVYAAHFMGAGGAKQLFRRIKDNPNGIAADEFKEAAGSNPNIFYENGNKSKPRTFKQVYEALAAKMNVDPGPALAKAGSGLSVGEKIGSAAYTVGSKAKEVGGKAVEKAKDIFGILGGAFDKIKDAFSEAFTKQFDDSGLKKDGILDGVGTNAMIPQSSSLGTSDEIIAAANEVRYAGGPGAIDTDKAKDIVNQTKVGAATSSSVEEKDQQTKLSEARDVKAKAVRAQLARNNTNSGKVRTPPTPSIDVKRDITGTSVSESFDKFTRELFGSFDSRFIDSVSRFPFASRIA